MDNYPKIKVRKRGADTCTDYLMLLFSLRFTPVPPCIGDAEDDRIENAVEHNLELINTRRVEAEQYV